MKKKILIILSIVILIVLIIVLFLIFKGTKPKIKEETKNAQVNVKKVIGVSKDNYYVYNKDNKYYVYVINDNKYISYLYILHDSETTYKEYKDKYRKNINAHLRFDDSAYLTIITINEGIVDDDFIKSIEEQHKDYKKIVE